MHAAFSMKYGAHLFAIQRLMKNPDTKLELYWLGEKLGHIVSDVFSSKINQKIGEEKPDEKMD